jgi:hypothetical protein
MFGTGRPALDTPQIYDELLVDDDILLAVLYEPACGNHFGN